MSHETIRLPLRARGADAVILHIGYHKTATSWLQRQVFANPLSPLRTIGKLGDDHPIRQLVRARPLDFDAAAHRARIEALVRPILDESLVPVISWERLSGHAVSGGYDSKELADRLHAVFPEGKVLAVIREQRAVILSSYKQYVMGGGRAPVEDFLEPPGSRNMRLPAFDLRFYEYEHLLGHYQSLFGRDAVLVLTFDQFIREPAAFVSAICAFAGRAASDRLLASLPYDYVRRPSHSALELSIRRRGNAFARSELNPVPALDSKLLRRMMKMAEHVSTARLVPEQVRAKREAALRATVGRIIGDRYRESNRRTAELAGLDLAGYGWPV
jgi:hypothetical protein